MTISFDVPAKDREVILEIAKRAAKFAADRGGLYPVLECSMDLSACIAQGQPLRLADLLAADDANFAHDIFGIRRHIDRKTGLLKDFFLPRYAAAQGGAA